jgi:hypothetical protein
VPGYVEGGARMAARFRLVLVLVVFARWSNNIFVFIIIFKALCTTVDDY